MPISPELPRISCQSIATSSNRDEPDGVNGADGVDGADGDVGGDGGAEIRGGSRLKRTITGQ